MPVSVVVGGQFGSEGKGKVALFLSDHQSAEAVVRVGGPNSGHTVQVSGRRNVFRQLPVAAVLPKTTLVLGAGSYIDVEVLLEEVTRVGIGADRLAIDPRAVVITPEHRQKELDRGLRERIGSTLTGTGEAVRDRISRRPNLASAKSAAPLQPFLQDTKRLLNEIHDAGGRIVLEGTQGYGLSLLHTPYTGYSTSRDTTAAGVLSEVGLSPSIVDTVALVLRAFPIRVPGSSGPLPNEVDWDTIQKESGASEPVAEITSVTQLVRRVARFDPAVVELAIAANRPNLLFLNHMDLFDADIRDGSLSDSVQHELEKIEDLIGSTVDYWGFSAEGLRCRRDASVWKGPAGLLRQDVAGWSGMRDNLSRTCTETCQSSGPTPAPSAPTQ